MAERIRGLAGLGVLMVRGVLSGGQLQSAEGDRELAKTIETAKKITKGRNLGIVLAMVEDLGLSPPESWVFFRRVVINRNR